jgi:hypothetical protein
MEIRSHCCDSLSSLLVFFVEIPASLRIGNLSQIGVKIVSQVVLLIGNTQFFSDIFSVSLNRAWGDMQVTGYLFGGQTILYERSDPYDYGLHVFCLSLMEPPSIEEAISLPSDDYQKMIGACLPAPL